MSCVKKMIIDSLCPPAVLYMGFSVIQIIIDLFRGQQNSAFLKVIVMTIFTLLLNQLCIGGLTILSWFIVFIPFIMMTYITTILLYVFGLNPSRGKHQPPDPRRRHKPHPTPYNPQEVGGCAGTEFGCCPDGVTASNMFGSNCYGPGPGPGPQPAPPHHQHHHHHHHHGHHYPPGPSPSPVPPGPSPSPSQTNYSCTPMAPGMKPSCHPDMNGIYESREKCEQDPSCPGPTPAPIPIGGCGGTRYGCCNDGKTPANATKSNCHSVIQKWDCVLGTCQQTPQGTHASLGDCMKKEKCYQN